MLYGPNQVPAEYGKEFITNPTRVRRVLESLTRDNNIADFAFGASAANNGGVVYDRVTRDTASDRQRRDAEERAPGTEFTHIDVGDGEPVYDVAKEYGAEIEIANRAIKRSDAREIRRRVHYLANGVVRKIDRIAINAIESDDDINRTTVTSWDNSSADPVGDLIRARGLAEDDPVGNDDIAYDLDTVLINRADLRSFFWADPQIREELRESSETASPIVSPYFEGYLGMSWVPSNRIPSGTLYMLQRGVAGALGDEDGGIQTDDWEDKKRRVHLYQAWRTVVPYITDPSAIVRVTGFSGN